MTLSGFPYHHRDVLTPEDADSYLYRIYRQHRASILAVVNRFKTLDPMYDQDDLEQEAFFAVRLAALYWEEARAINMKFNTYLNWHISRHFQGKFRGDDKVVDIVDANNRVLVTIPWRKYRKNGRAISQSKGYACKIRSLLVHYDDPDKDAGSLARHSARTLPLNLDGDRVVDIYNQHDDLIITVPARSYERMRTLVRQQGYRAHAYSIYEPPPVRTPEDQEIRASLKMLAQAPAHYRLASPSQAAPAEVVDVYTKQEVFLMRVSLARYEEARPYVDAVQGIARVHSLAEFPDPPTLEESEAACMARVVRGRVEAVA